MYKTAPLRPGYHSYRATFGVSVLWRSQSEFSIFHTLLSEITVAIFRHERLCWQSNTNLSFGGIFSLVDYFYSRPMRILLADSSCCCCDNKEKHGLSILRNNKWYSRIFGLWVGGNTMTKCLTVILFPVLQKTFFSYRRKFMVHQVFWLVKCRGR